MSVDDATDAASVQPLERLRQALLEVTALLGRADAPEIEGVLGVVRSALEAIRMAEADLARQSMSRREVLAPDALSAWLHDLREPVTAVAGWGQLLAASPAAVGRIRACEAIERNAKRLIKLLGERPAA